MGKIKKTIVLLLALTNILPTAKALDIESVFQNEHIELEEILYKQIYKNFSEISNREISDQFIDQILDDYEGRISKEFTVPDYFRSSVRFWFKIYSYYNSNQQILHDKTHLGLVYHVLNFDDLYKTSIHHYQKDYLKKKYSLEYMQGISYQLAFIAYNPDKTNRTIEKILQSIQKAGLKIPEEKEARKNFFLGLKDNMRIQAGQSDRIFQGILNSLSFQEFLYAYYKKMEIPKELMSIGFLESSFNPYAYSKVAAAGIWQFMPGIAKSFMPMSEDIDHRINPVVSSISSMHLLKQNFDLMKRWDLAITAYNSGTKHLVIARKAIRPQVKEKSITLEHVFRYYRSGHHGFASKNFYPCFLALVHALNYRDALYPMSGINIKKSKLPNFRAESIKIYLSKKDFVPADYIKKFSKLSPHLEFLNLHFMNKKKVHPKGTIFVSDVQLKSTLFQEVNSETVVQSVPKNWHKKLKD